MTEEEKLIQALQCCTNCACNDCPISQTGADTYLCEKELHRNAAERLEILLDKNAELHKQLMETICAKSTLDRLIGQMEVQVEHLRGLTQMLDPVGERE